MANINWYPGHMKKTREMIQENLKLVDVAIEVVDARIPASSRNPMLEDILGNKKRALALNKHDLADEAENHRWAEAFRRAGFAVCQTNSMSGEGIKQLLKVLESLQRDLNERTGLKRPLRMMVAGVPNVGKSSLINRLAGRKSAQTGNRPGVTRGKQWLALQNGMQLLDTPGILWPKLESPDAGINLAICGSIREEILDIQELSLELLTIMMRDYTENLARRYNVSVTDPPVGEEERAVAEPLPQGGEARNGVGKEAALALMEAIARKRGYILSGKRIDYTRTAKTLLDEFRSGDLGRITLEKADS
jgi:ribosome biogenesis GTPase A